MSCNNVICSRVIIEVSQCPGVIISSPPGPAPDPAGAARRTDVVCNCGPLYRQYYHIDTVHYCRYWIGQLSPAAEVQLPRCSPRLTPPVHARRNTGSDTGHLATRAPASLHIMYHAFRHVSNLSTDLVCVRSLRSPDSCKRII